MISLPREQFVCEPTVVSSATSSVIPSSDSTLNTTPDQVEGAGQSTTLLHVTESSSTNSQPLVVSGSNGKSGDEKWIVECSADRAYKYSSLEPL